MASLFDIEVAARTLAQEARGEPLEGRQAVAHVIKNRLASKRWGTSLSSVCLWHAQFSGWWSPRGAVPYKDPNFAYACNLQDGDPILHNMRDIIKDVLETDQDPTNGALFYYSDSIDEPYWVNPPNKPKMQYLGTWGRQRFYTDVQTVMA